MEEEMRTVMLEAQALHPLNVARIEDALGRSDD